jgi:hypothetical protein
MELNLEIVVGLRRWWVRWMWNFSWTNDREVLKKLACFD